MCLGKKFESDSDFESHVGDEDEVVGKIQNDELSTVQKCCIFLSKIEDWKVLGRVTKAKMNWNIEICKVWTTLLKSSSKSISGSTRQRSHSL